ncbi:hypothetical protein GCM10028809_14360 [Spirosoma gilvum]
MSCNEDLYVEPLQLTVVRGQVINSLDQQPLRRATLKLLPSNRLALSDSMGNFRFDSVLAGKYTLQAAKTGYGTEAVTIEPSAVSSPILTIQLTDDKTQNSPPTSPVVVSPVNNSSGQSRILTLHWKATDPNRDSLTYTVLLFKSGSTTPSSSFTGLKTDSLAVTLDYNTPYLWQVIVKDRIHTVNGDIWSFQTAPFPDYSYLFVRRVNDLYQIFGCDSASVPIQLTSTANNWRPVVSPNRQQIAYISNLKTALHLYVMNTDGSNARQVTAVPITGFAPSPTDFSFCWSPDGKELLYPGNDKLLAVLADGSKITRTVAQAPSGRYYMGCDWTSQNNRIVAHTTSNSVYDNEISYFPATGGAATTLLTRKGYRVGNPVFSPNGQKLVVTVDSSGYTGNVDEQYDSRIFLIDIATKNAMDLSRTSGTTNKSVDTNDLDPRFSPSGAQLIFTNTLNTGNGIRFVCRSGLDGRNRKTLFVGAEMPNWRQQK